MCFEEHTDLLRKLRKGIHINEDCISAIEWTKKYYPMAPLYRARFFPYFRKVNMVSMTFNPNISLKSISEVYEVQI